MDLNELMIKLEQFKGGPTEQAWVMNPVISFENDYIRILRIDTSNKHGGSGVENGKQWGIIVKQKKDFTVLPNWKKLKGKMGNDIKRTDVKKGEFCGNYGIRLYNMSKNMNTDIINALLKFIFE